MYSAQLRPDFLKFQLKMAKFRSKFLITNNSYKVSETHIQFNISSATWNSGQKSETWN